MIEPKNISACQLSLFDGAPTTEKFRPGTLGNSGYWKPGRGPWSGKKRPPISAEWRARMSAAQKGRKNRPHSEETRRKMSASGLKRAPMSEETKRRMSAARTGKKMNLSPEGRLRRSLAHKGQRHWNWKNGKTKLSRQIRQLMEYRDWRTAVFTRDGFACTVGGKSHGGDIHADHIKQFALILDRHRIRSIEEALQCSELWDISNGRTLCRSCHKKTETYARQM